MGYSRNMLGTVWKVKETQWAWAGVLGKDWTSKQIYILHIYIYNMYNLHKTYIKACKAT